MRRGYRGATFTQAVISPPGPKTLRGHLRRRLSLRARAGRADPGAAWTCPGPCSRRPTTSAPSGPMSWPGIDHWAGGPHEHELEPMSWEELGRLAAAGWEVGSHTRSHPLLTQVGRRRLTGGRAGPVEGGDRETAGPPLRVDRLSLRGSRRPRRRRRLAGRATERPEPCPHASRAKARCAAPASGIYFDDDARRFRLKTSPLVRRLRASAAWTAADRLRGA